MEEANQKTTGNIGINFSHSAAGLLIVHLSGNWRIGEDLPPFDRVQGEIESSHPIRIIGFDTRKLTGWDSGLLTFLRKVKDLCTRIKIHFDR